jgi:hypothetical protein
MQVSYLLRQLSEPERQEILWRHLRVSLLKDKNALGWILEQIGNFIDKDMIP